MTTSIKITFTCERCGMESAVTPPDNFLHSWKCNSEKKLAGYDYVSDTVLSIKVNEDYISIDHRLSDEDRKRSKDSLLCPACVSRYEDMLRDIVKETNEKVKSLLANKEVTKR